MIPPDFAEFGGRSWSEDLRDTRRKVWEGFAGRLSVEYMQAVVRGSRMAAAGGGGRGGLSGRCADAERDGGMSAVVKREDRTSSSSASDPSQGAQAMVVRGQVRGTGRRFEFDFTQQKRSHDDDFDVRSYVSLRVGPESLPSSGIRCIVKRFDIADPADFADPAYVECVALGLVNELFRLKITPCAFPTFAIARTACGRGGQQFVVMEDLGTLSLVQARKSIEREFQHVGLVSRVYHSILAQMCIALSNLQAVLGMTHLDLHDNNVMVTRVPVTSTLTYRSPKTGAYYEVPTWGYVLRIIDFGMADMRPRGEGGFVVSSVQNKKSFRKGTATSRTTVDLPYFCVALLRGCMEKVVHNPDRCFVWEHIARLFMRSFVVFGDGGRVLSGWEEALRNLFRSGAYDEGKPQIVLTKDELANFQDWIFSVQREGDVSIMPFGSPKMWLEDPSLSIIEPYRIAEGKVDRNGVVYPIFTTDLWDQDPRAQRDLVIRIKAAPGFGRLFDQIADSFSRLR